MNKNITITDPAMTRFNITMTQALDLIFRALEKGIGGEIFVPKLKAYKVGDMKNAIIELLNVKTKTKIIDVRPGEKYHEVLINKDEIRNSYENKEDYVLIDKKMIVPSTKKNQYTKNTKFTDEYSSDKVELMSVEEIKNILIKENLMPL